MKSEKAGIIHTIRDWSRRLKLSQRLIVVYMIGCFLPLVCVYIYMYNGSKQALLDQELTNESNRLDQQAQTINRSMDMAMELSEKLYYDEDVEKVAMISHVGGRDIKVNYREFDLFSDYLDEYYEDVSSICIYLDTDGKVDNRFFRLLTDKIKERDWYLRTVEAEGGPCWTYLTNGQTGKRSLRLTRVLYNEEGANIGVVSITLKSEITEGFIKDQKSDTIMVLNESELVHSNYNVTEEEIEKIMSAVTSDSFAGWMEFRGKQCIVSTVSMQQRYSEDRYTLVSIEPYDDIVAAANWNAIGSLIPLLLCAVLMVVVIIFLGHWFSNRINAFSHVMHRAAEGDFDAEDPAIGRVQDEIWELNQDLHVMIDDIQKLNETAMQERIQREQLYSRQKDVEFKMLAAQINPHFLYNTLENIRMMASINHEKDIADMALRLTKYLRSVLNVGDEMKTLKWEMNMVENYIKIQDYRFGDRIEAEVIYPKEESENYMILPFVLQPFVENAYVHAMEDMESGGRITVRVEIDEHLCLYIEDNGHGMSEEELIEVTRYLNDFDNLDRSHIGICNVNQRIKLKFGDEYGVDFKSKEHVGTKVQITMPLIRE